MARLDTPAPSPSPSTSPGELIGLALTRLVVPLWVLAGVLFKLWSMDPAYLPSSLQDVYRELGLNPYYWLALLIGLEFLAVAVMLFIERLARPMAIFVLSVFCIILIIELSRGNVTSCGCFGKESLPPWTMLTIDGLLLIGVLFFAPQRNVGPHGHWPPLAAGTLALLGLGASFAIAAQETRPRVVDDTTSNGTADATDPSDSTSRPDGANQTTSAPTYAGETMSNPEPKPLPSFWYTEDMDTWVGTPWQDIDLMQYLRIWPAHLDEGITHIIFYSRTCDHCEEMFYNDLTGELSVNVAAVEIPVDKNNLRNEDAAWPLPPDLSPQVEMIELPLGTLWTITSPLIITVEDGIIVCANEGDHADCFAQYQ